jgi:xyloglucan-specific exo-beta-1,4-glucanase
VVRRRVTLPQATRQNLSGMFLSLLMLGASAPYSWRNVVIDGGGFVSGIVTNPKAKGIVYARTDIGGAYRLDMQTHRWVPIMDWITKPDWNLYGVESLAIDPSNPDRVYVAAGTYTFDGIPNGAILKSSDQGRTWKRFDLPFRNGGNMDGRGLGERLMVDPRDARRIYFGTRSNGLWKSSDAGTTWVQDESFPVKSSTDGLGIGWVAFGPRSIVAAVTKPGGLYESVDNGKTWSSLVGQPTSFLSIHGKFDHLGDLVVTYGNGAGPNGVTDGAVWRRSTSGTWSDISPIKPSDTDRFGYAGLSFDPTNANAFVVTTLDRWGRDTIFRTLDSGKTWTSLRDQGHFDVSASPFVKYDHPKADLGHWIHSIEIDPFDADRAWYGTGATVWTTENLTAADRSQPTDWKIGAQGIEETAVIDLSSPTAGAPILSGLGDIGGFRHENMDQSPPQGVWVNPYLSNVDALDYAGRDPNLYLRIGRGNTPVHAGFSKDNGRTWEPLAKDPPEGRQGSGSGAIAADGKTIVWCPERASAPYFTSDLGATWTKCAGAPSGRVLSDKVNPSRFYLQVEGSVLDSDDGGRSFHAMAKGLPKSGTLLPSFAREGDLWLPSERGLLRSTDAGATFVEIPGLDSADAVGLGKAMPGSLAPTVYVIGRVGGVDGVYRSTDEGKSWVRINDAAHGYGTMDHITGDPKTFGRVYLGTNGRGVLVGDPDVRRG